jgi:hypothetical protein
MAISDAAGQIIEANTAYVSRRFRVSGSADAAEAAGLAGLDLPQGEKFAAKSGNK